MSTKNITKNLPRHYEKFTNHSKSTNKLKLNAQKVIIIIKNYCTSFIQYPSEIDKELYKRIELSFA